MNVVDAINGRRSVREYESTTISDEHVFAILNAGAMAPSAMDVQPCGYIIVSDPEKIIELSNRVKTRMSALDAGARFAEMMKLKKDVIFYGAPLVIFLVADKGKWTPIDCSLAAQNMMLRAYDLGLGSCFIGFADSLNGDKETQATLGMTEKQEIYCTLIFGHPKKWPNPKTREPKILNVLK